MEKQAVEKKEENKVCHHPYLKTEKKTADKVCTSCGRVIYSGQNKLYHQFSPSKKN